jgi:hypothetical protein
VTTGTFEQVSWSYFSLAIVVAGGLVSGAGGGLADGLLGVGVDTDLVVDDLDALAAHGASHGVALLHVYDYLRGDLDLLADSLEGRSANLGRLYNVHDAAVVLGGVVGGFGVVGRGSVTDRSVGEGGGL